MIGKYSENLKDIIVWDKKVGQPAIGEQVMNRRTELILVFDFLIFAFNDLSAFIFFNNLSSPRIYTKSDNWTVCTKDGQPSAHFEHTITITKNGAEILTK